METFGTDALYPWECAPQYQIAEAGRALGLIDNVHTWNKKQK